MGLAQRLHDETKSLHTAAERSGVMQELLRGTVSAQTYATLLASLRAIYAALEAGLREVQRRHPEFHALDSAAFARVDALEGDLSALCGPPSSWPRAHALADAYATHVASLVTDDPPRLFAHAWLRYLGDLNGGQIVARILRANPATAGLPTGFYEFPALADPRAAAAAWRSALDAAPIDAAGADALVREAQDGFRRHIALFEALASRQVPVSSPSE